MTSPPRPAVRPTVLEMVAASTSSGFSNADSSTAAAERMSVRVGMAGVATTGLTASAPALATATPATMNFTRCDAAAPRDGTSRTGESALTARCTALLLILRGCLMASAT